MASPFRVEKRSSFLGHKDCVYALCPHGDAQQFFSSGSDGMVVQWDMAQPDFGKLVAQVPQSVYALHFDSIAGRLFIGQNFEGVNAISLYDNRLAQSPKVTDAAIFDLLLVAKSLFVATGTGELLVLNATTLQLEQRLPISSKSLRCLCLIKEKNWLAIGSSDGHIYLLDVTSLQIVNSWQAHTLSVFSLCYLPKTRQLFSASRDAHLKCWQLSGTLQIDVPAHLYAINHVVASPNAALLATAGMDKAIKIWDAETLQLLKVMSPSRDAGHGTSVNKLLWSKYFNYLVSASDDRTLSLWHIEEK